MRTFHVSSIPTGFAAAFVPHEELGGQVLGIVVEKAIVIKAAGF
jgi:hypothetical protein